jgi:stage II sporulation protein D
LQKIAAESLGQREGAIIVIDPQNGRLRAVVNPRLAFEQVFPPGSAIKPFAALAALRAGLIDRKFSHQCQTRYARDDFEIVCSHPVSRSPFNLPQALAYSCNDFFARLSERLSESAFNSTLGAFGFGNRTGVNASEVVGELPHGEWSAREALGESERLLVTPIQLLTAYVALINGGHLYRPQRSSDHGLIAQEKLRLKIAPEDRAALIEGMRGSVKYGTASKAGLGLSPSYVFGKTGTSTASDRWRTQGWFVGFVAENNPTGVPRPEQIKLGALIFLKRAHGSQAAEVAKPIFDCGLRIADCELKNAKKRGERSERERQGGEITSQSAIYNPQLSDPQYAIRSRQSIRVRSISENVTRELPLEEYLVGALAGEASVENEIEALKAQAVVSRAFALKNLGRHAQEGYDFCSTTHCQRFVFLKTKSEAQSAARRAVEETAGVFLTDHSGQVVDAYFHAACGGMTANIRTLWGALASSHLRGVRDDFCATMPHRRWTQKIPADQLAKALRSDERTDVGARLDSILVTRRDATGRAEMITIEGWRRRVIRGWDFKIIVGRSLGWQMIKSSRFEVSRVGDDFIFRGGGFGHGLGLCQEGAHVAARRGMDYRQILNHYFPGTRLTRVSQVKSPQAILKRLIETPRACLVASHTGGYKPSPSFYRGHELVSWSFTLMATVAGEVKLHETSSWPFRETGRSSQSRGSPRAFLSSEHFRASYPARTDARVIENMLRALESARSDLLRRLEAASLRIAEPGPFEVVVHATTADFIAVTGQPGWAAGATRGRRIELQPLDLLRRRGVFDATLRHELTHAVIELLSGGRDPRIPRWMAEGVAIHVAGEVATLPRIENKRQLSREELERRLARPASLAESRKLYAMAYHEVRAIIEAEGEASVWRRIAGFKTASDISSTV